MAIPISRSARLGFGIMVGKYGVSPSQTAMSLAKILATVRPEQVPDIETVKAAMSAKAGASAANNVTNVTVDNTFHPKWKLKYKNVELFGTTEQYRGTPNAWIDTMAEYVLLRLAQFMKYCLLTGIERPEGTLQVTFFNANKKPTGFRLGVMWLLDFFLLSPAVYFLAFISKAAVGMGFLLLGVLGAIIPPLRRSLGCDGTALQFFSSACVPIADAIIKPVVSFWRHYSDWLTFASLVGGMAVVATFMFGLSLDMGFDWVRDSIAWFKDAAFPKIHEGVRSMFPLSWPGILGTIVQCIAYPNLIGYYLRHSYDGVKEAAKTEKKENKPVVHDVISPPAKLRQSGRYAQNLGNVLVEQHLDDSKNSSISNLEKLQGKLDAADRDEDHIDITNTYTDILKEIKTDLSSSSAGSKGSNNSILLFSENNGIHNNSDNANPITSISNFTSPDQS